MSVEPIAEEYIRLALAIDVHIPGYVDAYYGNADWKTQALADGPRPLDELSRRASALAAAIPDSGTLDSQQKDYLARQVHAMQTSLRLLAGAVMPLADETEALFDARPAWTDEAVFGEAYRQLDELLPTGDSLSKRADAFKQQYEITKEAAEDVLPLIVAHLRRLARSRFPLPAHESIEVSFAEDKPWRAYNWYLGGGRSRIDINADLPLLLNGLVHMLAHEAYPGHHTEACIKENLLALQAGRLEQSIALINSPQFVVSEGIASCALWVAMTDEDQAAWLSEELLPRVGLEHLDAQREPVINRALDDLSRAAGNAAFLLHERAAQPDEVRRYLQRYGLTTELEAGKLVEFLSNAQDRSYIFTYQMGRSLLEALFARQEGVTHWMTRLFTEQATPTQIRAWLAA